MDNFDDTGQVIDELNNTELRKHLRDALIDRDGWKIQAQLANRNLNRILKSPAWRITKPFRLLNLIAWRFKPELFDDSMAQWQIQAAGPTVWDQVQDSILIETNHAYPDSSKIAVVAQWSNDVVLSESTNRLIAQLIKNGFEVFLVSACEKTGSIVLNDEVLRRITIIRKPNLGYDFGSWSIGLLKFPQIFRAQEVLLVNDSNSGPFGSLEKLLIKMQESPYDITGITDSLEHRYHIQSYMMHFKNGSMGHRAMMEFWGNIRNQVDKVSVVLAYELGMTIRAQANGLLVGAIYPWNLLINSVGNPSVKAWERLLDLEYPFIKREVTRSLTAKQINTLLGTVFRDSNDIELFKRMLEQDSEIKST